MQDASCDSPCDRVPAYKSVLITKAYLLNLVIRHKIMLRKDCGITIDNDVLIDLLKDKLTSNTNDFMEILSCMEAYEAIPERYTSIEHAPNDYHQYTFEYLLELCLSMASELTNTYGQGITLHDTSDAMLYTIRIYYGR